jgi:hypothetical protein
LEISDGNFEQAFNLYFESDGGLNFSATEQQRAMDSVNSSALNAATITDEPAANASDLVEDDMENEIPSPIIRPSIGSFGFADMMDHRPQARRPIAIGEGIDDGLPVVLFMYR